MVDYIENQFLLVISHEIWNEVMQNLQFYEEPTNLWDGLCKKRTDDIFH